jgi:hypothetical protein
MGIKQDVVVNFGPVDQRRGDKHLIPGRLTEAINVYQDEEGVYCKREGFTTYTRNPDFGTINSGTQVSSVGSTPVFRTADTIYARNLTALRDENKGDCRPVLASRMETGLECPYSGANGGSPSHYIDASGNVWAFSKDIAAVTLVTAPLWRVFRKADGAQVKSTAFVSGDDIHAGKVIANGAFLYFFFWTKANVFRVAKFTIASTGGVPVVSTLYTPAAGTVYGFDVMLLNNGDMMVGICRAASMVFFLVDSTGAFKAAPGAVSFTGFTGFYGPGGFAKNSHAVSGSVAYWYGLATNSIGVNASVIQLSVNASTCVASSTVLDGPSTAIYDDSSGVAGNASIISYSDPTTLDRHVFFVRSDGLSVTKYLRTFGGTTTISTFGRRSIWFVTEPFQHTLNGTVHWMAVAQIERRTLAIGTESAQTAWYLVDLETANVLARAGWGRAGRHDTPTATVESGFVTNVTLDGNIARFTGARTSTGGSLNVDAASFPLDLVEFDLNPTTIGPPIQVDGEAIFPGAWPIKVSRDLQLDEIAPSQFPENFTTVTGVTDPQWVPAGTYTFAFCYEFLFPGNRVVLSVPSPKKQHVLASASKIHAHVPTLRIVNRPTGSARDIFVRAYVAPVGQTSPCMLQQRAPNNPGNDTVEFLFTKAPTVGEVLPTDGGALDTEPPPSFSSAFMFKNRVFVTGCETGDTWYSDELISGRAAGFNGARTIAVDGVCGGALDGSYAAILTPDSIYVISGDGMDDIGVGGFELEKLLVNSGTVNPNCCPTRIGLFFVGRDNGIWVITPSREVLYVGRGIDDYRSSGATITGIIDLPDSQQVRVTTDGGALFVFDYGRRPITPSDAIDSLGQWYAWTTQTNYAAVGTVAIDGVQWNLLENGALQKQVAGQYFDDASTWYGMRCTLPLSFAGVPGFEGVSRGVFMGTYVAPHQLKITAIRDGAVSMHGPVSVSSAESFDFRPAPRKGANWEFTIEELQQSSNLNAAFKFQGIGFSVMVKPGLKRNATRM